MERLLFLLFFIAIKTTLCYGHSFDSSCVIKINKYNISTDEFLWRMQESKGACYSYFIKKYGNHTFSDFWTHDFNGEQPLDWIIKLTIKNLINDYSTIELMQKFGLLVKFDFYKFKSDCIRRNGNLKNEEKNGKIIYGNTSQSDFVYYDYLLSNAEIETKKRIFAKYLPTEFNLEHLYDSLKNSSFKKYPNIQAEINWTNSEKESKFKKTDTIVEFKSQFRKEDETKWGNIFQKAITLKKGDSTGIFQSDNNQLCSIRCLNIEANGYLQYNEVKNNLITIYTDILFDQLLNGIRKSVIISIHSKYINRIKELLK